MPCNTVILISGSGSNLQAFIDSARNGELDTEASAQDLGPRDKLQV